MTDRTSIDFRGLRAAAAAAPASPAPAAAPAPAVGGTGVEATASGASGVVRGWPAWVAEAPAVGGRAAGIRKALPEPTSRPNAIVISRAKGRPGVMSETGWFECVEGRGVRRACVLASATCRPGFLVELKFTRAIEGGIGRFEDGRRRAVDGVRVEGNACDRKRCIQGFFGSVGGSYRREGAPYRTCGLQPCPSLRTRRLN